MECNKFCVFTCLTRKKKYSWLIVKNKYLLLKNKILKGNLLFFNKIIIIYINIRVCVCLYIDFKCASLLDYNFFWLILIFIFKHNFKLKKKVK